MPLIVSPVVTVKSPVISPILSPVYSPLSNDARRAYFTNLYYTRTVPVVQSENLNYNDDARKRTIKYFYYKIIQKWFYNDIGLKKILCFISNNDFNSLVKSIDEYKKNKETKINEKKQKKKIKFLTKYFITKKLVDHILNKFSKKYNIQWIHMHRNQYKIKEFFAKQLYKKMIKEINS